MRVMIKIREPFTIRGGSFLFIMWRKAEKGGTNGNGGWLAPAVCGGNRLVERVAEDVDPYKIDVIL